MMKISVLLMLFTVCNVHCNVIPRYIRNSNSSSSAEASVNMNSKVVDTILNGSNYLKIQRRNAIDCADLFHMGQNKSGVYEIWPISRLTEKKYIEVYCDMDTNGGGWTVIQRRGDFKTPKDYFYRGWESYKEGFGDIEQDFWLGNDNIYALTNQKLYSVRFDLKDVHQNKSYALFDKFWIDDESNKYTLHIDMYTGDAGDSMVVHKGRIFSTFDKDDANGCAKKRNGGWWYHECGDSNLNGLYHKGKYAANKQGYYDGMIWRSWKELEESLEWTEIKIRPKHFRAPFV